MVTFPTEIRPFPIGITVALYPSEPTASTEVQRAPDSSGSPDVGNAEVVAVVSPGGRTYTDARAGGTWHYRIRHVRPGATASDWTHWVAATADRLPDRLPDLPILRDPVISLDVDQTGGTATWTLTVEDPDRLVTSDPRFQRKTDAGGYNGSWLNSWDTSTGTEGEDGTLTREEAITLPAKHVAALKARVQWTDHYRQAQEEIVVATADLDLIAEVTNITIDFDADGKAVVSATGDEDTEDMYVKVGDGAVPADPTAASNDGSISGRSGTASTGVKITIGNEAVVKVAAADSGGTIGTVTVARQARRIGPGHFDTTSRSVTETTGDGDLLETISIPAGILGASGGFKLTLWVNLSGTLSTQRVLVELDGTRIATIQSTSSSFEGELWIDLVLYNNGSGSSQNTRARATIGDGTLALHTTDTAVATSGAVDLTILGDTVTTTDEVELQISELRYLGAK